MSIAYGPRKTLDPRNEFKFVCPVFKAETKIASCFAVRDLHYRGEGPPTRRGCQVAMTTSKCPMFFILRDMLRVGDDPYHSDTPVLGKLRPEILDHIAPIMSPESIVNRAVISEGERNALLARNEEAVAYAATRGKRRTTRTKVEAQVAPLADVVSPTISTDLETAAKSGDMTAAINAEIEKGE